MILTSSAEAPADVGLVAVAAPGGDLAAAAVVVVAAAGFATTGAVVAEAAGFAAASGDFAFCKAKDGMHSVVVPISPQVTMPGGKVGMVVVVWGEGVWEMLHSDLCDECKCRPLVCETMKSDGIAASHGRQWIHSCQR